MNETLKVIADRRSVRLFKEQQIPGPELDEILTAGLYAPNARNMQKRHFTVIQDGSLLDRMVEIIKENLANSGIEFLAERARDPGYNTFYRAPTVAQLRSLREPLLRARETALAMGESSADGGDSRARGRSLRPRKVFRKSNGR